MEDIIIKAPLWIPLLVLLVIGYVYLVPEFVNTLYAVLGERAVNILFTTAPLWICLMLFIVFWDVWMLYVRSKYLYKLEWVLLELKLPQDITKSPLAMETFLMSLHQTGKESTFIDRNWKGQLRAHFSLEIVSIEGVVKFFIYTQVGFRNLIEAGLYAQYQNIEIHETPDYTRSTFFDPKESDMYVIDYKLSKPDAYPIKTYIDYGLDRETVDEENKVDPINTIVEFMGSIGANQQLWLQIIIKAHKDDAPNPGPWYKPWEWLNTTDKWKDEAKAEIEKVKKEILPKEGDTKFPNPTKGQQEKIAALERSVSKMSFDVGIRSIYIGKKGFFNGANIGGQRNILRAYAAPHLNYFSATNWLNEYDYPWQDFMNIRQNSERRQGLEAYKRRSFHYPPFNSGKVIILNVEELASIFHLPGRVATTPNLARIPSKKSQAPANLPI